MASSQMRRARSVPVIEKSVGELGFKFSDVKILLGNHAHGSVQVGFARRDRAVEFDQSRERLTVEAALLHGKCAGQKLFEGCTIEGWVGTHTHTRGGFRSAAGLRSGLSADEHSETVPPDVSAVSHRANARSSASGSLVD